MHQSLFCLFISNPNVTVSAATDRVPAVFQRQFKLYGYHCLHDLPLYGRFEELIPYETRCSRRIVADNIYEEIGIYYKRHGTRFNSKLGLIERKLY